MFVGLWKLRSNEAIRWHQLGAKYLLTLTLLYKNAII